MDKCLKLLSLGFLLLLLNACGGSASTLITASVITSSAPSVALAPSTLNYVAINCHLNGSCALLTREGYVLYSNNEGVSWKGLATPLPISPMEEVKMVDCPDATTCYVAGIATTGGSRGIAIIFSTADSAKTWNKASIKYVSDPGSRTITCPSLKICYVLFSDKLILTKDGGKTWEDRNFQKPTGVLMSINCITEKDCFIVGGMFGVEAQQGFIVATDDGWNTLIDRTLDIHLPLRDISCASKLVCIAVSDISSITIRTENGGRTWEKIKLGDINLDARSVKCYSKKNCIILGLNSTSSRNMGMYRSLDEGVSWNLQTFTLIPEINQFSCIGSGECLGTLQVINGYPKIASTEKGSWELIEVKL